MSKFEELLCLHFGLGLIFIDYYVPFSLLKFFDWLGFR